MSDAYPNIYRIEDAPGVSWSHRRALRRLADSICRRTGMFCSFNQKFKCLLFHLTTEPDGGPLSLPAFHPDGSEKVYAEPDIDRAVEFIGICRAGKKAKDVWAARQRERDKWERGDRTEKYLADIRPDAKDFAKYLDDTRRGTRKVMVSL